MSKVIWSFESNGDKLQGGAFVTELEKSETSKGNFTTDYNTICSAHGIIPCPYITATGSSCRMANARLDLANWRAALIAIAMEGSSVKELSVHACGVTGQHLDDVIKAIEKMGGIAVLKLDYLTIHVTDGDAVEEGKSASSSSSSAGHASFLSLLKGSVSVEYLSLKGNSLNDFCKSESFYNALSENLSLKALSLAENKLDDVACGNVLAGTRQAYALTELSLSRNLCSGSCLPILQGIFVGAEVTPDAEAKFRNLIKLIGDKNKGIKDANKLRKKKGLPDLVELIAPSERIEAGNMANRTVRAVDLSFCPLEVAAWSSFVSEVQNPANQKCSTTSLNATIILRGCTLGLDTANGTTALITGLSASI